jgi:hypothetical protein
MANAMRRLAILGAVTLVPLSCVTVISPGTSYATECGQGTVFDAPSNTCVAAWAPPPPPPPWNGDPTPGFSVGICAPIPFVALCTGI